MDVSVNGMSVLRRFHGIVWKGLRIRHEVMSKSAEIFHLASLYDNTKVNATDYLGE